MDLCRQSDVSAFEYAVSVGHSFPSKEQAFSNFVAAVPSAVILEPPKIKSVTVSIVSPSICPEVIGSDAIRGVLKARILKWFPILFSSGPHLSELFTMTQCPSWVALHSTAHSFIELDKTVVHVCGPCV